MGIENEIKPENRQRLKRNLNFKTTQGEFKSVEDFCNILLIFIPTGNALISCFINN